MGIRFSLSPLLYLYRLAQKEGEPPPSRNRPLYDIPYMFEAREFMRKKLIGKKVRKLFEREREKERESEGGRERERESRRSSNSYWSLIL